MGRGATPGLAELNTEMGGSGRRGRPFSLPALLHPHPPRRQDTGKLGGAPARLCALQRGERRCGGARPRAGRQPGLLGSVALPGSRGTAPARGKGRPARGTHLLVLVGTHHADHGTPLGRTCATPRKQEQRPPAPASPPCRAPGCGTHTPSTADGSHARPEPQGSAMPPVGGLWAGSRRPPWVGRPGDWGEAAGRRWQKPRLLLLLASPIGSFSPRPYFLLP